MYPYVFKTSVCTLSTTTSIWFASVGMSCNHLDKDASINERLWISFGIRSFVSSNDCRTALTKLSPSLVVGPQLLSPFRNTHGFSKVEVSILLNNSQKCSSCRWQA